MQSTNVCTSLKRKSYPIINDQFNNDGLEEGQNLNDYIQWNLENGCKWNFSDQQLERKWMQNIKAKVDQFVFFVYF